VSPTLEVEYLSTGSSSLVGSRGFPNNMKSMDLNRCTDSGQSMRNSDMGSACLADGSLSISSSMSRPIKFNGFGCCVDDGSLLNDNSLVRGLLDEDAVSVSWNR